MAHRTVLATIAGSEPHQRLQVALVQGRDGRLVITAKTPEMTRVIESLPPWPPCTVLIT